MSDLGGIYAPELRRLTSGPGQDEALEGIGIEKINVKCKDLAEESLTRMKQCLFIALKGNFSIDGEGFPGWFLESFEEGSPAASRFLRDGNDGPVWNLTGWLFWLRPDERLWRWWDGEVIAEDEILVALDALEWPAPTGALKWLFYAAGAIKVDYLQ
jgi:hypothetical protein